MFKCFIILICRHLSIIFRCLFVNRIVCYLHHHSLFTLVVSLDKRDHWLILAHQTENTYKIIVRILCKNTFSQRTIFYYYFIIFNK